MQVLNNVDLMEEDKRVENREGGVVEDARQYNVFEILQAVGGVDLSFYRLIFDSDHFLKLGLIGEILSVVSLVEWEVWVVCGGQ